MSLDFVLFGLRLISALILCSFVGALFYVIWREFQQTASQVEQQKRIYGELIEVVLIDDLYTTLNEKHPIKTITTMGRAPTNHIVIDEAVASSEHAMIALRDGQWWLEDRNSRNGTSLNQELIASATIITDDDIIGIGNKYFKFTLYH